MLTLKNTMGALLVLGAVSLLGACSRGVTSTPDTPPAITAQPTSSVTVVAPAPATFTVAATGTTPAYQWTKAGVAVEDATSESYTTPATTAADDGATFAVTVSNARGSVQSDVATLHVNHVRILGEPQTQVAATGSPVTYTVVAAGAAGGTFSYQWKKNGAPLNGATEANLFLASASAADVASYSCDVIGHLNGTVTPAVTSATATLVLLDAPVITAQPVSVTVPEGSPVTLSVTATVPAGGALSYQWRLRNAAILGATSPTFTIPVAHIADQGSYSCVVTNTQNSGTALRNSSPALVTVVGLPTFTRQPEGATVVPGQSLTLRAAATGNGVISYQWQKDGADIAGATSANYAIESVIPADDGSYVCLAKNTQYGVTATQPSNAVAVVVQVFPTIASEPGNRTVMAGQSATFSLTAKGENLTYAWYKNGTLLPSSNAASYTTDPASMEDDQAQFWCVVSNGHPPDATSAHVTLTVTPPATTFKSSALVISKGEGVTLTYAFDAGSTATLKIGSGTPTAVVNGGSQIVSPYTTTVYTLAVTTSSVVTTSQLTVTVKTYTPRYAYVVSYGSNDIRRYPVDLTSSTPLKAASGAVLATGAGPVHVTASPDEKYLYVANNTGSSVSAYSVDDNGVLTSLGAAVALSAYTSPWASVVEPSGRWLYVAAAEGVAVFTLTNGVPTAAPELALSIPGRIKGDLLVDPSGAFLIVLDNGHNKVKAYAINAATGALTFSSDVGLETTNPSGLTFDRASRLVFTRGADERTGPDDQGVQKPFNAGVEVMSFDLQTGALAHKSTYAGYALNQAHSDAVGHPLYLPFVPGKVTTARHGLAYSKRQDIDTLLLGYATTTFGLTMSQLDVDTASGTILGDSANPLLGVGTSPYFLGGNLSEVSSGGDNVISDRGGSLLLYTLADTNQVVAYTENAQGWLAAISGGFGDIPRSTGTTPSHACFVGTLQ